MNLHLPQTEEARAEAATLMDVRENLITPRSGEPLVAATQVSTSHMHTYRPTDMHLASACFLTRLQPL